MSEEQKYALVTMMSTPDVLALKLHQLEQSLLRLEGDDLIDYVSRWIEATREVMVERFGELRDFGASTDRA
jgi:hypothetical protein